MEEGLVSSGSAAPPSPWAASSSLHSKFLDLTEFELPWVVVVEPTVFGYNRKQLTQLPQGVNFNPLEGTHPI